MKVHMVFRAIVCSVLLAAAFIAVPASASARTRVYVRVGPPASIVEVRGVAPGPRHVWIPGYHTWNGAAYVWTAGRWAVPPRARAVWVAGHWVRERRGWYFVEGHWR